MLSLAAMLMDVSVVPNLIFSEPAVCVCLHLCCYCQLGCCRKPARHYRMGGGRGDFQLCKLFIFQFNEILKSVCSLGGENAAELIDNLLVEAIQGCLGCCFFIA